MATVVPPGARAHLLDTTRQRAGALGGSHINANARLHPRVGEPLRGRVAAMKIRAVQIERSGGPDEMRVTEVDLPAPGPGEVRIRHHAIGVNFTTCTGAPGSTRAPCPRCSASRARASSRRSGRAWRRPAIGTRVAYVARTSGSYAEARNLPAEPAVPLPDAIDFEQAAAMMLKGLTVQYLLRRTRVQLAARRSDRVARGGRRRRPHRLPVGDARSACA